MQAVCTDPRWRPSPTYLGAYSLSDLPVDEGCVIALLPRLLGHANAAGVARAEELDERVLVILAHGCVVLQGNVEEQGVRLRGLQHDEACEVVVPLVSAVLIDQLSERLVRIFAVEVVDAAEELLVARRDRTDEARVVRRPALSGLCQRLNIERCGEALQHLVLQKQEVTHRRELVGVALARVNRLLGDGLDSSGRVVERRNPSRRSPGEIAANLLVERGAEGQAVSG